VHRRLRQIASTAALLATAALAGCGLNYEPGDGASHYTEVKADDRSVRLHSEEGGRGDPVLLLHGFGANAYSFRHIRAGLETTHHAIAVDLKGFGRSDKPLDADYSAVDQARLLADLVERRNLRRLTIVGHSYGGAVAMALALELNRKQPGRLARIVLLDGAVYQQGLPPALHVLRTPVIGPAAVVAVPPEVQSTAALLLAYHDPSKITQQDIAAYARPLYEAGNRHALARTADKIIPEHANILTHQYRTIPQPVLLVWCRNDKIVPLAIGQRLVRELQQARLEVIETCGHVPQEEEPAATLALLRRFLAEPIARGKLIRAATRTVRADDRP
jgi:pimeloyl-ACP methyl ester carboxylesterase